MPRRPAAWSDGQIAEALDTSIDTIARTRQQLVEEGLDAAPDPQALPQPDPVASGVGRWLARVRRWTLNADPVAAAVGVVAGASARSRRGVTARTKRFRCRSARQTLEPRDLVVCLLREPGGRRRRRSPAACACDRRAHVVPAGAGANRLRAGMLFNSYPFLLAFLPGAPRCLRSSIGIRGCGYRACWCSRCCSTATGTRRSSCC